MEKYQNLHEHDTPLGSPFAEAYTTTTGRGAPSMVPITIVQTENFYTPLYTNS